MLPQATHCDVYKLTLLGICSLCLPVSGAGCVKCFAGSGTEEESAGHVAKQ